MSDQAMSGWLAKVSAKHGFEGGGNAAAAGNATATQTASQASPQASPGGAPTSAGGDPGGGSSNIGLKLPGGVASGARGQADAAVAAAGELAALATRIKTLETAAQTAATEAQTHGGEATAAKTKVDQSVAGIPAAPSVPTPQGADPKAKYDSSIQISGQMRKAQQDAEAKAGDVDTAGIQADTAAKLAEGKANEAAAKATEAEAQAAKATQAAQAAATAAKNAAAEAAKTKAAAGKAEEADKAARNKAAQDDAQHASRAKAAATKAVGDAKAIAASGAGARTHASAAEKAKTEARQAADGIQTAASGVSEKLAPFGQVVSQAEAQEAQCKSELSAEDAEAVLQKRYEELGGDAELERLLAAEDKEFETRVERHRVKVKDWQKDRIRALDAHKSKLEESVTACEAMNPAMKTWYDREQPAAVAARNNFDSLGEKTKTEPGKEVGHLISQHEASIETTKTVLDFNTKHLKNTQEMLKALDAQYENVDAAYEAAEKYVDTLRTELDNELQVKAAPLEEKVNFLQSKPKPVRDRIQKQLESNLAATVANSSADTMAEVVEFQEQTDFEPKPIDWASVEARTLELASTSLETLKAGDPELAKLEKEYEAAGGDNALFQQRVTAWKKATADYEKQQKQMTDEYLKQKEALQKGVDDAEAYSQGTTMAVERMESELAANRQELKALQKQVTDSVNPDGSGGPSPQLQAQVKLLSRTIAQQEKDLAARKAMLAPLKSAQENATKMREAHAKRHQTSSDDDAWPAPKKPESKDIHAMPLRAKHAELVN